MKMQMSGYPDRATFGLLPEPEGRSAPFVTSATVNLVILGLALYVGMTAKHVIQEHKFAKIELQMQQPKINMPKIEPKPALKPLEMDTKLNTPEIKAAKPAIILAPQP